MKWKTYINGLLLSFQFFTIVPIHRALPMDAVHLRAVLRMFPLFGLIRGLLYASVFFVLIEWSPLSTLGNAFLFWLLPIVWTGALHLDGWIDTSDAFFSYRDRERRLEILKDSRVGAFGVLSLIVLLAARFLFFYEIIAAGRSELAWFVAFIPFYSQMTMGLLLNGVPPAKKEGLAYYFQQGKDATIGLRYSVWLTVISAIVIWFGGDLALFLIFLIVTGLFFAFARRGTMKHFGGITGDVLGASLEGVETALWMTLWLLVSIGMG
ncbi:adenosylcobinamide-GDP ribazoletransferase [Bacillus sp. REN10]|uniref:adenosylcobinamide-GDP ribazoletransferase n=1 Tax=Bacillus sp. REN10 TaxID=2782541 RepID=UPI00193C0CFE|nr:adenosylcobinamide-GDP ribazoletransferase [Bacillus sp. REN10]